MGPGKSIHQACRQRCWKYNETIDGTEVCLAARSSRQNRAVRARYKGQQARAESDQAEDLFAAFGRGDEVAQPGP